MSAIESALEKIERRYDPEFNFIPNSPYVTWTEVELVHVMRKLLFQVEELKAQIEELKAQVDELKAQVDELKAQVDELKGLV